eukprot:139984_1
MRRFRSLLTKQRYVFIKTNCSGLRTPLNIRFSRAFGSHQDFLLSDIGEGITEVEVLEWFVKPGDRIEEFDKICLVQSDKANAEITSRYAGVVKTLGTEVGEIARVGEPILSLDLDDNGDGSEEVSSSPKVAESQSATIAPETSPSTENISRSVKGVLATPACRALAREHGVDLAAVRGTGRDGRVQKSDILAFVQGGVGQKGAESPSPAATPSTAIGTADLPQAASDEVVQIRGMTRTMVSTMTASNAIPTLLFCDEVRMDRLEEARQEMKVWLAEEGVRLTLMPFFIKAASLALLQYPIMNSLMSADVASYTRKRAHNIAMAVDTPQGLIVPVMHNVQDRTITDIAREGQRLATEAISGQIKPEDMKGGTFSLSNIGAIGGTITGPLILPPQVAIGAIGCMRTVPRYNSKMELSPTKVLDVSWSADHRIIDGATIARFSRTWKAYIEQPERMLLDMK